LDRIYNGWLGRTEKIINYIFCPHKHGKDIEKFEDFDENYQKESKTGSSG